MRVLDPDRRPVAGAVFRGSGDAPAGGPGGDLLLYVAEGGQDHGYRWIEPPSDRPDLTAAGVGFAGGTVREVVLPRGLHVRGFLHDGSGEPIGGVEVRGGRGPHVDSDRTATDGSFEVGPFPEGPVVLRVEREYPDFWKEDDLSVPAGQEGVVLRYREGLPLLVRVTGESREDRGLAQIADEGTGAKGTEECWGEVCRFPDLPPDRTFTFLLRDLGGIAFLPGLRPGGQYEVEMRPGSTLEVRLVLEGGELDGKTEVRIRHGVFTFYADAQEPARWTFSRLPDVACDLEVDAVLDGRPVRIRQPVRPGEGSVEIPLPPR